MHTILDAGHETRVEYGILCGITKYRPKTLMFKPDCTSTASILPQTVLELDEQTQATCRRACRGVQC